MKRKNTEAGLIHLAISLGIKIKPLARPIRIMKKGRIIYLPPRPHGYDGSRREKCEIITLGQATHPVP